MTEKSNLTPKRRFTKFQSNQAWTLSNLGEMASFSKGNGYSKNDLTSMGKPIILYGRLYKKYETIIEYVDTFTLEKENSVISTGDEVIIPASGESSEDISRASVVSKPGIILGGDLNIVRPNNEIDPVFLALSISNGKQQKELSKRAQGKSVVHLHNSDLKEVNLFLPKKVEQIEIGDFFKKLDNSIILQKRKLEKTKALKAAYLTEMFPAEGELSPKRRFAGFTQDWKCIELKEIVDLLKDGTHGTHANGNDAFLLSAKNIKNGQVIINKLVDRKISSYDYDLIFKNYKLIQQDLLVTIVGTIGQTALYTESTSKIAFQRSVAIIRGRKNIDQSFLKFTIDSSYVQKQLKQSSSMSAQAGVYLGDLEKLELFVPELSEQKKIGSSLNKLDQLIQSQQKKLEKLQNLKKAYLHEMFV